MKVLAKMFLLTGLLALTLSQGAYARDLDQDEALRLRREGVIQPLEQLMRPAMERYPQATLLEAELEEEDDVLVYEIELLTQQGQVRELELDARDGRILKDEEDD
ncbi:PepSY domain-containing protein [Pseudomonas sp. RL_15y_Pfl2_60]|uniref:PepSY domain-containing protein n=1 Tax=Pseudomonas sp. RL_15y_Pfl2_60 TaxID=3088709 RepID=UPI0030DB5721